jgi:hypothetical protein
MHFKSYVVLIAATVMGMSQIEAAEQKLQFKGVSIGEGPEQSTSKYPQLRCNDPKAKAAMETGVIKQIWEGKQLTADYFCATISSRDEPITDLTNIAGHKAIAVEFSYFGNELKRGLATVKSVAFLDLVATIIERYGPPTSKGVETLQNRAGAKFESEILKWHRGNATLQVTKYHNDLETSSYSLTSDDYWEEVGRRRSEKAKSNVQKGL